MKTRNTNYCQTVFDCPTPPPFLRKVKSKVGLTRPQPHMTRYKVQIIELLLRRSTDCARREAYWEDEGVKLVMKSAEDEVSQSIIVEFCPIPL